MSAPSRLSSLLVRDGVIGVKRMEQAFQRQVIYGGALDTILLEMAVINEDRLLEYLSLATGLPTADRNLLDYFDPRAIQVCPRTLAEEYHIAPLAFDGEALRVLVNDPVDLARLELLATTLGIPVQPFVVPEFRLNILWERLFGVQTPARFASLASKLVLAARANVPEPKVVVEDVDVRRVAESPGQNARSTAPLSSDAISRALEAQAKMRRASQAEAVPIATPESITARTVITPPANLTAAAGGTAAETPAPVPVVEVGPVPVMVQNTGATTAEVLRAPFRGVPTLDATPLEPKAASAALEKAADRDAIFAALVRGVRSRTTYVALLVVQGDMTFGRLVIDGDVADTEGIAQLALPSGVVPALQSAVETRAPYIGPVATGDPELDGALATLGGLPSVALLLPVVLRERVVALVYAHRRTDVVSIAGLSEVLPLAGDAAMALSRLIVRAKSVGYRKPEAASPAIAAPVAISPDEVVTKKTRTLEEAVGDGAWASGSSDVVTPAQIDFGEVQITAEPPTPMGLCLDGVETGVEPVASDSADEALRRLDELLPALRARLPGKLTIDRYAAGARRLRASQHGPLLALAVRVGARMAPIFAELMSGEDREARFYATLACIEIRSSSLIPALVGRLFDPDYGIRAAALEALMGYPPRDLDGGLDDVRKAIHGDAARARAAAHALGELRDLKAIPDLIDATERDHTTAEEARRALLVITKQDFGTKAKKWRAWWEKNNTRPRMEWMLDGLAHAEDEVRLSASEELKQLTGEYFGYHYDLSKREREEARLKWLKWWEETGRRRFVREGAGGENRENARPTAVLPTLPRR
jgi:hypothetical protein